MINNKGHRKVNLVIIKVYGYENQLHCNYVSENVIDRITISPIIIQTSLLFSRSLLKPKYNKPRAQAMPSIIGKIDFKIFISFRYRVLEI